MTGEAILVRGLRKSYGRTEAVRGIDVAVERGEVFALLGPNGAGKTTTVEILEGHRPRTAGEVTVLGFDPAHAERAFKERIGIVLQETGVEPYLTVAEAVELYAGYYPNPRPVDEVIDIVGLNEQRDVLVTRLSGGQKRRLDVGIGLAGDPDLLFLDEPTTGFDPAARREAWETLRNLRKLGKTIFLTTHYMDEAQQLADRAAIIVAGQIVASGTPSELTGRDTSTRIRYRGAVFPEFEPHATVTGDVVEIRTERPVEALHSLTGWAISSGATLDGLQVSTASLEEVYLELTAEVAESET
ncbi:MAG TPA: ABC transporter ATP-binding protein [Actinomycetota bacterium]|nr:ABC transporter ATP-binding protein [Actinomycetota bacterium]